MIKRILYLVIITLLLLNLSRCVKKYEKEENITAQADITLGTEGFESSIAQTYLIKQLLMDKGYNVAIDISSKEDLWEGLSNGNIDATVTSWFYDINYDEYKSIENEIIDLGDNCKNYQRGYAVINYSQIAEISELKMYKKKFDGKIYTFNDVPVLHDLVEKTNKVYQLDYEVLDVSEDKLVELLNDAKDNEEWIVIAAYTPHWIFKEYDLRFLADPLDSFGTNQESHTLINKDYENEEIYSILDKFYIYLWELNDLLFDIHEKKDNMEMEDIIVEWLNDNPQLAKRLE